MTRWSEADDWCLFGYYRESFWLDVEWSGFADYDWEGFKSYLGRR